MSRSEKLGDNLAVADGHYYDGRFAIQQRNAISGEIAEINLSDDELIRIASFRGMKLVPISVDQNI